MSVSQKEGRESEGDARQLSQPVAVDHGQVADERLCGLQDFVVDDPSRRRLASKQDRRRVDVQDLMSIQERKMKVVARLGQ